MLLCYMYVTLCAYYIIYINFISFTVYNLYTSNLAMQMYDLDQARGIYISMEVDSAGLLAPQVLDHTVGEGLDQSTSAF